MSSEAEPQTPLEKIIEKRGYPGISSMPAAFIELFELKDVLPEVENVTVPHS